MLNFDLNPKTAIQSLNRSLFTACKVYNTRTYRHYTDRQSRVIIEANTPPIQTSTVSSIITRMADTTADRQVNDEIFKLDDKFWNNYLKGRPQPPDTLFDRIFGYHDAKSGVFDTVHDVGAGNGPHADRLADRFKQVIISDIAASNVELAKARLGIERFRYRAAKVEDADDIPAGSVDLVFATNVMHFPDQDQAMNAVAKQLKPGGTFAAALFGPARFEDAELQDLWERINYQGGRMLLAKADQPDETITIMARTQGEYNVAPLDPQLFEAGAKRLHLNLTKGGITGMLPPEAAHRNVEPNHTGPSDIKSYEDDDGWNFAADLGGVKEHIASFPFLTTDAEAFKELFAELETYFETHERAQGYFPVKIILATRR
jgi:SAM-dependent methyltransferase